jgi:hypothetical protein
VTRARELLDAIRGFFRCVRIHTKHYRPPQYRADTGQAFRLIGDRTPLTPPDILDYSDDEEDLLGIAVWWTTTFRYGAVSVQRRNSPSEPSPDAEPC